MMQRAAYILAACAFATMAAAPQTPAPLAEWTFSEPFDRAVLSFQGPKGSLADATPCHLWVRESADKPWREVAHQQFTADGKPQPLPKDQPHLDADTVVCPAPMTQLRVDPPTDSAFAPPTKILETHWIATDTKPLPQPPTFAGKINVPFIPQRDAGTEIMSRVCSPAVVTMMLRHAGINTTITEVAAEAYDKPNDIYGNWTRAAWVLSANGVPAHVHHLTDAQQIDTSLAAGNPIAVSIRYGKDELPGALVNTTSGHLVLIIGQTATGDFILNDPASYEHGAGITYPREPFLKAMANAGNITYVIDHK